MRIPTTAILGNLRWTESGTVWADWLLSGMAYKHSALKTKRAVRDAHTAFYRALPGESLLISPIAIVDPSTMVDRMISGIDLEDHPAWAEEALATYDTLAEIPLGKRLYWLSVPLGSHNLFDRLRATTTASLNRLTDQLSLPRAIPDPDEVARRTAQAKAIAERLPMFSPRPATAAQMLWLHQHMLTRGLYSEGSLPTPGDLASDLAVTPRSLMGHPHFDEGCHTDATTRTERAKTRNPLDPRNQVLKVTDITAVDGASSYQVLGVISKPPAGGMEFPGSETLGRIDESGLDIDWVQRIHIVGREKTISANQSALANLKDQIFHTGGDDQSNITANADLALVENALQEYVELMASDDLEVETRITTILATGAPDRASAVEQLGILKDFVSGWHHKLVVPVGNLEDLWWAMQPGAATSAVVRDLEGFTTSKMAAGLVPMIDTSVGSTRGAPLCINLANGPMAAENLPHGPSDVIFHDLDGASKRDTVGSMAVACESGGGKSVLLKKLVDASLDKGGIAVIVDRTEMGEYALWAKARLGDDVAVVEIIDPQYSFDPLRLFSGDEAATVAQGFFTTLLHVHPTEDLGMVLSEVLDPQFRQIHGLQGSGDVADFLLDSDDHDWRELGRKMRVFKGSKERPIPTGRVVFDSTLPAPDITKSMVVRTNRMELPKIEQLTHEHLFKQMPISKIFGHSYYGLIAGYARNVCFRDRTRQALFVMDEVNMQVSSPDVEAYLKEFNLDGRKHRAAAVMAGQSVMGGGMGSPELLNSFPTRIVGRFRDRQQATAALTWMLGGETPDEELVEMVTTDTSPITAHGEDEYVEPHRRGEFFLRDGQGRQGRGKVIPPTQKVRYDAAMATGFGGAK